MTHPEFSLMTATQIGSTTSIYLITPAYAGNTLKEHSLPDLSDFFNISVNADVYGILTDYYLIKEIYEKLKTM
jgi:hypothetical protein